MIKFKAALAHDIEVAFLNQGEFAEELTIDGVKTIGIWDDTATSLFGQSVAGLRNANAFGLNSEERVLYVNGSDITMPMLGQRLEIDGEFWVTLPGTKAEMGILLLKLLKVYS